jgi:putative endopeptidase
MGSGTASGTASDRTVLEQGGGQSALEERSAGVRPQDDLFRHVNGRWLDEAEIPSDRASAGTFYDLNDAAEAHLRAIVEAAAASAAPEGTDERRIGDLYASFLDEQTVERLGTAPLQVTLAVVDEVRDLPGLALALGRLARVGVTGALGLYVNTDAGQSDRYLLHLTQAGIGLPDESYYREETFAPIREAYDRHVVRMLGLVGHPDPERAAPEVVAVEARLAAVHWDRVAARDAVKSYNRLSRAELAELAPHFDWSAWLEGLAAPATVLEPVVVRQPDFLRGFSQALEEVPLEQWREWLRWRVVRSAAAYLSKEVVDESFAFYGTTLTGAPEQRERWKRGIDVAEGALGDALGRLYVAEHFPPRSKQLMLELVANLVEAYREDIEALDWMGPETRKRALDKLDRFTPKVGYPDEWRDYSGLEIRRDDLLGNVQRSDAYELDRELRKLGGPVDRSEWFMTPQTVNAYYNSGMNEIVFPAAILQPPFFDPDADAALNYGAIGAVIGHEIGHGFDDQGSRYDGDGNLHDWWTDEDRAAFEQRAARLIAQFDALEPAQAPGQHVNGALTVGENIGDLGGLTVAAKAYQLATADQDVPVIDGLTGQQRLFLAWARVWRGKARDAEVVRRLAIDPHAPNEFRCNAVVRNLDEFVEAFGVQEGDGLWLAPEERVRIW